MVERRIFLDTHARNRLDERARVIKALAHPTRLFLMEVLSEGELCVCDLTRMVGDDISTVSKHLDLLWRVGIVARRREGKKILYNLATPCALNFLTCVEEVVKVGRGKSRSARRRATL